MKIQLNSDKTIVVDARLTRFVEGEVNRVLSRFTERLTRVEIHVSDVDNRKTGQADKRCLIEVRPAGARPMGVSAKATKLGSAVGEALGKMQRSLTTFFGRRGQASGGSLKPDFAGQEDGGQEGHAWHEKEGHPKERCGQETEEAEPTGPQKEEDLPSPTKTVAFQIAALQLAYRKHSEGKTICASA